MCVLWLTSKCRWKRSRHVKASPLNGVAGAALGSPYPRMLLPLIFGCALKLFTVIISHHVRIWEISILSKVVGSLQDFKRTPHPAIPCKLYASSTSLGPEFLLYLFLARICFSFCIEQLISTFACASKALDAVAFG